MQSSCFKHKTAALLLAALLALASCESFLWGDQVPTAWNQKPSEPLAAEVVAAWEKVGARSGWLAEPSHFRFGEKGKPGEVPAFWFKLWEPGVIGRLPQPARGFALCFQHTSLTDTGLKELAGLRSLRSLNLWCTEVTDAGLKELAGLRELQILILPPPSDGRWTQGTGWVEESAVALHLWR